VRDSKAVALENSLDQPTLRRVVVDDENRFSHMKTPTETGLRLMGRGLLLSRIDTAQQ
jgi:hypothetical protein